MKLDSYVIIWARIWLRYVLITLCGWGIQLGSTPSGSNVHFIESPPSFTEHHFYGVRGSLQYIVVASLVICVLRCRCNQIMRGRFISGVFLSVSYLLYLALIPPPSLKFSSSSTGWFNSISKLLGKAGYLHILEKFYLNLYNYI